MCMVVSSALSLLPKRSCVPQRFYNSLPLLHGSPKASCPVLLCGYCFHASLSFADRGAEAKALAGRGLWRQGMQSGLGQPKLPRRNWQGHPGLERPQKEGRDTDKDRGKECRVC